MACTNPTPAEPTGRAGRWRPAPRPSELAALGYVDGSRPASTERGVFVRQDGHHHANLFYTSGHAPGAWLMDDSGRELRSWSASWEKLFPQLPGGSAAGFWRRAILLPDLSVVGVFEGLGMVRLNADNEVVWKVANQAHHDLVLQDGALWTLVRSDRRDPAVSATEDVVIDALVRLDPDTGAELSRWELPQAVRDAGLPVTLTDHPDFRTDLLHTNSVHVLQKPWRDLPAGSVLLSFLATSRLAVFSPGAGLTWTSTGPFRHQHDPYPLADGSLLVFDNEAGPERSRVVRWTPGEEAPSWTWSGINNDLWSATCGAVTVLPNDNLLVTESDAGRVWEVSPAGEVVWAWASPHRAGRDRKLVATLFEVQRADLSLR